MIRLKNSNNPKMRQFQSGLDFSIQIPREENRMISLAGDEITVETRIAVVFGAGCVAVGALLTLPVIIYLAYSRGKRPAN